MSSKQGMKGEVYIHDGTELKNNQVNISSRITALKAAYQRGKITLTMNYTFFLFVLVSIACGSSLPRIGYG